MSRIPSDFLNASSSFNETNNLQYISTPGGSSVDLLVMSFPGRPPMVPGIPVPPSMTMPYMGIGAPPPLVPTVGIPMTHMIAPPPLPPMPAPPIRPYRAAPHHHNHSTSAAPAPAPASSIPPLIPPSSNMRSNSFSKRVQQGDTLGPPVTVFVGNITERAPDAMIRHILSACGHVVSWKRVQGASAFGFCEYGGPEAGLRAVRLLHDLEIGGKKLVVKVDAKTKLVLDNYKGNCRLNNEQRKKLKESGTPPPDGDMMKDESRKDSDGIEETDYMDEVMKHADEVAQERIQQVVADYEMDIKNYTPPASKSEKNERKMSKTQEKLMKLSQGSDMLSGDSTPIFDDQEMEEGKRDLITREIGKFREIMKKQEEEKEAERRRREMKERERKERDGMPITTPSTPPDDSAVGSSMGSVSSMRASESSRARMSPTRSLSRSRSRERLPSQPPRSPSPPDRHGTPSSTAQSSTSSRMRSKARDRDRGRRSHSRSRDRDDAPTKKSERDLMREREEEEEAKEKKKMDRRAREKEAAYQERLRNWEARERRKAKEAEKERERERLRQEEQAREAKRLKEFLEDYDDERDDPKYYKGRELQKRLAEREKENEQDSRDRQREREELEELKARIYAEGHSDPGAEFERLRRRREEQYRPTILVRVDPPGRPQQQPPLPPNHRSSRPQPPPPQPPAMNIQPRPPQTPPEVPERDQPPEPEEEEPEEEEVCEEEAEAEDDDDGVDAEMMHAEEEGEEEDVSERVQIEMERRREPRMDEEESQMSRVSMISSADQSPASAIPASNTALEPTGAMQWGSSPSPNANALLNNAAASTQPSRKKKLDVKEVFNMDDDDDSNLGTAKKRKLVPLDYGEEKKKKEEKKEDVAKSQEDKRKHIKTLIDKIPTEKEALFAFQLDWAAVDNQLMERRIRPWINKKIIEYIGEPEPTLVDFICSKVLAGSAPQGILDDVQMVLDDEAEVFVVKMWRLLIYEIEAKKMGLAK